jgi:hypothetical protein
MTELTLLYTHQLRGQIALLPRLYTFIKGLRGDTPKAAPLIDLGDACAATAWHCAATGGRSMLVAMDSLGYAAINASGLDTAERARLREHVMSALIDDDHTHTHGDLLFARHLVEGDGHLCVVMTPGTTTLQFGSLAAPGRALYLAGLRGGQIGQVSLTLEPGATPRLRAFVVRDLPPDTPPDPTIAGIVDFVLDEARYYHKRGKGRGEGSGDGQIDDPARQS